MEPYLLTYLLARHRRESASETETWREKDFKREVKGSQEAASEAETWRERQTVMQVWRKNKNKVKIKCFTVYTGGTLTTYRP